VYVLARLYCNQTFPAIPPQIHITSPRFSPEKLEEIPVDKGSEDGQNPYHSPIPPHMTAKCKHPIVKIVAREEDAEFVECQKCGEVFDSAEFSDIAIEEEEALAEPHGED
jgi:hypothetical protein